MNQQQQRLTCPATIYTATGQEGSCFIRGHTKPSQPGPVHKAYLVLFDFDQNPVQVIVTWRTSPPRPRTLMEVFSEEEPSPTR